MVRIPRVATVDFETLPIMNRPHYPPEPVGVAIRRPQDRASKYYAFGHPSGNNCSKADARRALREVWESDYRVVFHNSKFDADVAEVRMGLPPLLWERMDDTMFLAFLSDPHAPSFALKPLGEKLLGRAPDERDEVVDWLVENLVYVPGTTTRLSRAPKSENWSTAPLAFSDRSPRTGRTWLRRLVSGRSMFSWPLASYA